MTAHTAARISGVDWFWYRARLCDEFPCLTSRKFQWFLFDADREYVGQWDTKRQMLDDIKDGIACD